MKNYAKFCKIKIDDQKYSLNLTEKGLDTARFSGRFLAFLRLGAPIYMLIEIIKMAYTKLNLGIIATNFPIKMLCSGLVVASFCLPFTSFGDGFNAILKEYQIKRKIKKYYKKIRKLEEEKTYENRNKICKKQCKITNKFVKYLKKCDLWIKIFNKKYDKIKKKKGYVEGLKSFAKDNLDMLRESVDKFIFHNYDFLTKTAPKHKKFLKERFLARFNLIYNNNESYYDEYLYSATHPKNDLVKNDCLDKKDNNEDYYSNLRKYFELEILDEDKIIVTSFEDKKSKETTSINTESKPKTIKEESLIFNDSQDDILIF